jgi:hypothetical protein
MEIHDDFGFERPMYYPDKTHYANDVLQTIFRQEYFYEIIEKINTEVFDDIMDFMQYYSPDWYKYVGSGATEFILTHISLYIDLYDDHDIKKDGILSSLYFDLDSEFKKYYSAYKTIIEINEAYNWKPSYEENEG